MATTTRSRKDAARTRGSDIELTVSRLFAQAFQAYLECGPAIQQVIMDMVRIVNDPETDPDDAEMSLATIHEALFPAYSPEDGQLGVDMEEEERKACGEEALAIQNMDGQESIFAARVEALLKAHNWTQGQLAEAIGVGQPAVSLLLTRKSRPQRRTVEKVAKALGVSPSELWPGVWD
jgi:lambda repressor-like predicted transcriptional regulator